MQDQRVVPEVPVFNSLIAGYGRQGDAKAAFKLFNDVRSDSLLASFPGPSSEARLGPGNAANSPQTCV